MHAFLGSRVRGSGHGRRWCPHRSSRFPDPEHGASRGSRSGWRAAGVGKSCGSVCSLVCASQSPIENGGPHDGYVSDAFEDGQWVSVLCIVDDCAREALATVVDRLLSGGPMTRERVDLIRRRGQPDMIFSENGTEKSSQAVLRWCQETGVGWHDIALGKPMLRFCGVVQWHAPRPMLE